jgi:hypothetical protein
MARRNDPNVPNSSMASLPVQSEDGSSASDTILASSVQLKLQADSGLLRRRKSLPSEKQSVKSIDQLQPQPQVATLSPPVGQFVINSLLQVAGFIAAIAFGVYAVKSVDVGHSANESAGQAVQQAVIANQLAILAVCGSFRTEVGHLKSPFRFRKELTKALCRSLDRRHWLYLLSSRQWCSVYAAQCSFDAFHKPPYTAQ